MPTRLKIGAIYSLSGEEAYSGTLLNEAVVEGFEGSVADHLEFKGAELREFSSQQSSWRCLMLPIP